MSERNAKLLETIEMLREQLVEKNDRLKIGQDHYKKIIQDLLIPHKVYCSICLSIYVHMHVCVICVCGVSCVCVTVSVSMWLCIYNVF